MFIWNNWKIKQDGRLKMNYSDNYIKSQRSNKCFKQVDW